MTVQVVMKFEPIPTGVPAVMLVGPTATNPSRSWRPAAVTVLRRLWPAAGGPLAVLVPETRDGIHVPDHVLAYEWERDALEHPQGVIAAWMPCQITGSPDDLLGLTSRGEICLYLRDGRVVLGCPPDPRNTGRCRWLVWTARRYGVPVCRTLEDTMTAAVNRLIDRSAVA